MNKPEGDIPEFKWGDSRECEAVIRHTQLQKGKERYVVPFGEHKAVDLGSEVKDTPEILETTIQCDSKFCHLSTTFRSEGMGFSAYNQATEKSVDYVRANCGKWKALVKIRDERGEMPRMKVPQAKETYLP